MRSTLATPNYGLATVWIRDGKWRFEAMAMGQHLGTGLLRMVNNELAPPSEKRRELSILGDPTLRSDYLALPGNFTGSYNLGKANLSWTSLTDGTTYYVYKASASNPYGPFTKVSIELSNPTFPVSYDGSVGDIWMLRAVKTIITASGSYKNISQGVYWH